MATPDSGQPARAEGAAADATPSGSRPAVLNPARYATTGTDVRLAFADYTADAC